MRRHAVKSRGRVDGGLSQNSMRALLAASVLALLSSADAATKANLNELQKKRPMPGAQQAVRVELAHEPTPPPHHHCNESVATHGGGGASWAFAIDHCDSLHLWNLELGEAGAKALAIGLAANRGLATLNLEHNVVGDAGAEALADAKLVGSTAAVDLAHNRMTQAGRDALDKAGEEGGLLADAKPKHEL